MAEFVSEATKSHVYLVLVPVTRWSRLLKKAQLHGQLRVLSDGILLTNNLGCKNFYALQLDSKSHAFSDLVIAEFFSKTVDF